KTLDITLTLTLTLPRTLAQRDTDSEAVKAREFLQSLRIGVPGSDRVVRAEVKRPAEESEQRWLAKKTAELVSDLDLLNQQVLDAAAASDDADARKTVFPMGRAYLWKGKSVSPDVFVERALAHLKLKVEHEPMFAEPSDDDGEDDSGDRTVSNDAFLEEVRTLFIIMFRIFAIFYHNHFQTLEHGAFAEFLNLKFKMLMFLSLEHALIPEAEFAVLREPVTARARCASATQPPARSLENAHVVDETRCAADLVQGLRERTRELRRAARRNCTCAGMALTSRELRHLGRLLGDKKSVMASGVVQLYLASPDPVVLGEKKSKAKKKEQERGIAAETIVEQFPKILENKGDWVFTRVVGALAFVVDRELETYLFQIFDLKGFVLRFQFELYEDIDYQELHQQFHAFELDHCVAGFNFAEPSVARTFYAKVNSLKPKSANTRAVVAVAAVAAISRSSRQLLAETKDEDEDGDDLDIITEEGEEEDGEDQKTSSTFGAGGFASFFKRSSGNAKDKKPAKGKRSSGRMRPSFFSKIVGGAGSAASSNTSSTAKSKKRSTGPEIGNVTGVVRNNHIALNADGTLDLSNIPSEWKSIFREAGIRKRDLKDPSMFAVIHDAMQSVGVQTRRKTVSRRRYSIVLKDDAGKSGHHQSMLFDYPSQDLSEHKVAPKQPVGHYTSGSHRPSHHRMITRHSDLGPRKTMQFSDGPWPKQLARGPPLPPPAEKASSTQRETQNVASEVEETPSSLDLDHQKLETGKDSPQQTKDVKCGKKEADEMSKESGDLSAAPEGAPLPDQADEPTRDVSPSLPAFLRDIQMHKGKLRKAEEPSTCSSTSATSASPAESPAPEPNTGGPAFLQDIAAGMAKLRPVSETQAPAKPAVDTRPKFLQEIERGVVELRHVEHVEELPELEFEGEAHNTLLSKLKKCVMERRLHINDDEQGNADDSDDDWSDEEA
ncbi:Wiskott-Aldrich syndrome protein homolog 1, partial [Durusdinium trenchii]